VVGVDPVARLIVSQLPPDAVAVNIKAVPLLAIDRFWIPGVVEPEI
jgi:hypothetical protein